MKKNNNYKDNKEYCLKWQKGNKDAGNILCSVNSGLIEKTARLFTKKYGQNHYDDFYQAGKAGLLEAAKKYDPSFETEFSKYALPYIKQKIMCFEHDNTKRTSMRTNEGAKIKRCAKRNTKSQELNGNDRICANAKKVEGNICRELSGREPAPLTFAFPMDRKNIAIGRNKICMFIQSIESNLHFPREPFEDEYIAILDCETNYCNEIISVGTIIVETRNLNSIKDMFYGIVTPECEKPAKYRDKLEYYEPDIRTSKKYFIKHKSKINGI